jgi:signal transduction histidine kinase/CheY-like chemotaxis protein
VSPRLSTAADAVRSADIRVNRKGLSREGDWKGIIALGIQLMEVVGVSEIAKLKQRVNDLERELAFQKKIRDDLKVQVEGRISSEGVDVDTFIREEVERQTHSLREALELAEKDKRSNSEFLANISHEILTPMDGILGMTGLVLETELSDEQRRYLEMVSASGDRLLSVINDILDYSQIEAGKLNLDSVDFDLHDLLECDLYILKLAAQHKKIDLLHYIDPNIPKNVRSDPERLRQVLVNLVNNAIKFTEKGLVTVDVTTVKGAGNLTLRFSITDTGIGIPYDKQKGIFHSLGSSGRGLDQKYSGAGLGLAVSAKLVALAGGEIGLESDPGAGATFWFTWPVAESAEREREIAGRGIEESMGETFVLKGARVLLAEDEPISGAVTEKLLQQAGVDVTLVENGELAVEELDQGKYQLVLMDVQMPVMDGLAATQEIRIRERRRGGRLPVIALTAHAMQGDRERCLQAGMDDYLSKPINKDQLIDMLLKYLTNTALVVDGDQVSQQAVVQVLIESGWRVTIVETDRSALYEASLSNFDLIVINTVPPASDGIETARAIRKLEEYSGRHVIIIGIGVPGEDARKNESDTAIDDFIRIPVSMEEFREKLLQLKEQ